MERILQEFDPGTAYANTAHPSVTEVETAFSGLRAQLCEPDARTRLRAVLAEELSALRQDAQPAEGNQ